MKQEHSTHTINGIAFIIEQDRDGWFWHCDDADGGGAFPEQSEALADAIHWVKGRAEEEADAREAEEEARVYGSYEEQVRAEYRATRL